MSALILIVDDSPEDREAARVYLSDSAQSEGLSLRFTECSTGEAGLAACEAEAPDCILLDHHLPDMDALEFLERLKEGPQALLVPVIVLTGSMDPSLAADALRAGAQDYLPKQSIAGELLFNAVRSAQHRFKLLDHRKMTDVWKALASSRAETRTGQFDLLTSQVALSSARAETQSGLVKLLASAAALSASRAETEDGLTDLVASAAALSASQAETRDGRTELLANAVVNKALNVANTLLIAGDVALRKSEAQLREVLATRQGELERLVTERTHALVEAESRFRGIFDSQFQFITVLAPDGTVLEMNQTALDAAELTRADIIGRSFWETNWWSVDQHLRVRQDIALAAAGGVIRREVEIMDARKQDQRSWIDFSLKPVSDPTTGAVIWILAESHDLTEKRDLATQLAQAQRVQALGQLAAGIAHDFNNILQVVSGSAALIAERPGDLERTRRLARTAIAAADRGISITQRLLSFARRGELRAEPVATADLLVSLGDVLTHTLGDTITVRVDVQPDVPALIADRSQLETALINLGTNARDAMPDGGVLTLSAEAEQVREGARHPIGLVAGDYIRLTVADDGAGMDETTLARVSEPFFTTKPQGKGTGLGLAMVRGFAEQSGGGIAISSAPSVGTTVVMWLRQASEHVIQSPNVEDGAHKALGHSVRVLVVDDDDLVREVLAAQLEAEGLQTLVAASGQEALALIEAGEVVDVLVSDLSMPGLNGVTTIERARKLRPLLPCFLLTGYVGDVAALSSGNDFTLVRKPIIGRTLAAQIEAAVEGALLTN